MSNPDSRGAYWLDPASAGRREDPYDRGDHYARPVGGNGRPAGNGSYGNGYPAAGGRPVDPADPSYGLSLIHI